MVISGECKAGGVRSYYKYANFSKKTLFICIYEKFFVPLRDFRAEKR